MKLNLGCGHNPQPGFVNVDSQAAAGPDQVVDLETLPWPWETSSVSEVMLIHVLEHLGGDPKVFLGVMSELWRVCAPDAVITVHVPHPRHDNFLNDPTHVRVVTPDMLRLFDRRLNDAWQEQGAANSPLAHYTGIDFEVTEAITVLAEPWAGQLRRGEASEAELAELLRTRNNIAHEYRIKLRVRKSPAPAHAGAEAGTDLPSAPA